MGGRDVKEQRRRGASICGRKRQHRGAQEERDVVCVTQFCVLMEDSTAISPSVLSQHHHRDNEVRELMTDWKAAYEYVF